MDGSATRIRGEATPLVRDLGAGASITDSAGDDVKYLGTMRARVGGAVPFANTDVLLYGTAGLAWERLNRADNTLIVAPPVTVLTQTVTPRDHFGWVAGVGGEVRLGATGWIGRVEYLHYDFGTVEQATTQTITGALGSYAEKGGRQTIDVVRGGLSYKFDSASSPLSAYAASMPVKALPPAAWSWAGFYLGAHGGYGWKQNDFAAGRRRSTQLSRSAASTPAAGSVGGQAGYNWQFGRCGRRALRWTAAPRGSAATATPLVQDLPRSRLDHGHPWRRREVSRHGTGPRRRQHPVRQLRMSCCYGTGGLAWERVNRTDATLFVVPGTTQTVTTTVTPRDHVRLGCRRRRRGPRLAPATGSAVSNICTTTSARSNR